MKKTLWLLACFGILSAGSCHKKTVEPAFQNSFSCKVNGVDWKPEGGTNAPGGIKSLNIDVGRFFASDAININTLKQVRDSKTGDDLVFEGINVVLYLRPNEDKILSKNTGDFFYNYKNGCTRYYPDSTINDKITIVNLDTVKNIVKGTFRFEAKSPTCGEKLLVTDGKFVIKY